MTYREWNAVVSLGTVVLVCGWLANDALSAGDLAGTSAAVAWKLIWATGAMIVITIVANIVFGILAGMVTRDATIGGPADERERAIEVRAARNSNIAVSAGGLGVLLLFALGYDPAYAVYGLFGALVLGGVVDAVSQLVLYRVS